MIEVDFSRCPRPLWWHQQEGVKRFLADPRAICGDEVGVGKSAQIVTAICTAFLNGEIDAAIISAPAFVRSVWASPDALLGEFVKWVFPGLPFELTEYCSRNPKLPGTPERRTLQIVVTNYEFLRVAEPDTRPVKFTHLPALVKWAAARNTWLVLDESWAVKNHKSKQTRACYLLRQGCERVALLNGTPGTPDEQFPQFQILDSGILGVTNWFHFRAKYCVMGGWQNKQIVGYQNMDEFTRRTAPFVFRREAKDCLDLPPVLPPMTIEATLTPRTWAIYTQMRDELLAWLDKGEVSVALQAGVRSLRLAQVLAGFLGGVQGADDPDLFTGPPDTGVREIGREKLDAIMAFLSAQGLLKVVVWTRFRAEASRIAAAMQTAGRVTHMLVGQQPPDERDAAKRAFAPGTAEHRPAVLVGHPAAGGAGINLAAASMAIYATNGFSLKDRQQSEGRLNRPGQTSPVRFVDVVAVGPRGQKTLDHAVLAALRNKHEIAAWSIAAWRDALRDE